MDVVCRPVLDGGALVARQPALQRRRRTCPRGAGRSGRSRPARRQRQHRLRRPPGAHRGARTAAIRHGHHPARLLHRPNRCLRRVRAAVRRADGTRTGADPGRSVPADVLRARRAAEPMVPVGYGRSPHEARERSRRRRPARLRLCVVAPRRARRFGSPRHDPRGDAHGRLPGRVGEPERCRDRRGYRLLDRSHRPAARPPRRHLCRFRHSRRGRGFVPAAGPSARAAHDRPDPRGHGRGRGARTTSVRGPATRGSAGCGGAGDRGRGVGGVDPRPAHPQRHRGNTAGRTAERS